MAGPWDKYADQPTADTPGKPWEKYAGKPASAAKTPPTPESPTSAKNLVGAATEPIMSMATGALAAPVSGITGLVGSMLPGPEGRGANWQERVANAMTYEPKTEGGKTAAGAISYPFEKIHEGARYLGGKATDVTGSPLVGTGVSTALEAIPQFLGAKGAKAAARDIPGVLPTRDVSPAAKHLLDKGADLSPGQMFGGAFERAEQQLSKWPIVGAPIRGARARAFEGFNDAVVGDVLEPVGGSIAPDLHGHKAVDAVREQLGDRYDDILSRTIGRLDSAPQASTSTAVGFPGGQAARGGVPVPPSPNAAGPSLRGDLTNLRGMIDQSTLPIRYKREFGRIMDEEVLNRFQQGGVTSGETLKQIDSQLRQIAERKGRSEDYNANTVGLALKEARASIKRMIERENPGLADELKATDTAYARFKIMQQAAANAGKDGMFTPAQFERAVKSQDKSKDKARYAEGKANMQQLAKDAREAIGDAIPDSGTPSQFLLAAILTGKGHGILGAAGGALAASALALPYSRTGSRVMRRGLTGPGFAPDVAGALPFGAGEDVEDRQAVPPK